MVGGQEKIVVAVSGGFDPLHIGHVRYIEEARKLGDELVVILNNDNWLRKKKGFVFMPEGDRKEIIEALRCVDRVILTKHVPDTEDMSVLESLKELRPSLFANGGDRTAGNIPEYAFCEAKGITLIFNVGAGGKVRASSDLLADFHAHIQARKNNP